MAPHPGGRWCPGLPGLWWCQVEHVLETPSQPLCLSRPVLGVLSESHQGCVVVGRKLALCPRSCFCSLAPTDGPVQEPLGSGWGLLPGPEHICPQHLSVSQALTVTAGQPGGFAPSHSSRMLSVNGTRLFSGRSWSWHCVFVKRV